MVSRKYFQVVGKALLLLADVELLDVVDEFLLQAVLVVIHIRNLLQSVNDVLSDLLHASLLVWFDASQERLDVIHFLSKFLLKSGSFLLAEGYEMVHSLANCIFATSHSSSLNSSTSVFVVTSGRRNRVLYQSVGSGMPVSAEIFLICW